MYKNLSLRIENALYSETEITSNHASKLIMHVLGEIVEITLNFLSI